MAVDFLFAFARLKQICAVVFLSRDPVPGKITIAFISSLGDVGKKVCTYGDLNALIGQDESSVGACQFGVRHVDDVNGLGVEDMEMVDSEENKCSLWCG